MLNGFELSVDDKPVGLPISSQRLVAFLALQQHAVRRMFVAGTLWTDSSEQRSLANLRSCLWRTGASCLDVVDGSGACLRLSAGVAIDLVAGTRLAREALACPAQVSAEAIATRVLWDDVLPDWYDDWVVLERERFRQLRMHALETIALSLMAQKRFAEAVDAAHAAVAAEPLRESSHRVLIKVHLAEGNPVEALRDYQVFRRLLADELDLEPSPQIRELLEGLTTLR